MGELPRLICERRYVEAFTITQQRHDESMFSCLFSQVLSCCRSALILFDCDEVKLVCCCQHSELLVTIHVLISSVLLLIVSKSVLGRADMFPWYSLLRLLLLLICWCFSPQLSDDLEPSCLENNKTDPPVVPYGRLASHHVERTNKCIGYWISWLNFWY